MNLLKTMRIDDPEGHFSVRLRTLIVRNRTVMSSFVFVRVFVGRSYEMLLTGCATVIT
jgi:hypothetical protein